MLMKWQLLLPRADRQEDTAGWSGTNTKRHVNQTNEIFCELCRQPKCLKTTLNWDWIHALQAWQCKVQLASYPGGVTLSSFLLMGLGIFLGWRTSDESQQVKQEKRSFFEGNLWYSQKSPKGPQYITQKEWQVDSWRECRSLKMKNDHCDTKTVSEEQKCFFVRSRRLDTQRYPHPANPLRQLKPPQEG